MGASNAGGKAGLCRKESRARMSRRAFLSLAAAGAAGCALESGWWETWNPFVVKFDLPIPRLPASFDGYRILHLTDFHHSNTVPIDLIDRFVTAGRSFRPDLVAFTGDFVTTRRLQPGAGSAYAEPCAEVLSTLVAPDGLVAVLGNHDNETGRERVLKALERSGIEILLDRGRRIERGSDSIWLSGVDDYWTSTDAGKRLDAALAGRLPEEINVMLAHNPDQFPEFVEKGVDLALSGHTHGGQIVLPFWGPLFVPSRYGARFASGLFREKTSAMWVNRGIGTYLIPIRVNCRAELAMITLRRPA